MDYYDIFRKIKNVFNKERCVRDVEAIYGNDRLFTFPAFARTARYCKDAFLAAGLSHFEMLPLRADGKTVYGDWVLPRAWDVRNATLKLCGGDGDALADYARTPCSLMMNSAPTPAGGVTAQLVYVDDIVGKYSDSGNGADNSGGDGGGNGGSNGDGYKGAAFEKTDLDYLAGKLLFTSLHTDRVLPIAKMSGAAGIVSDHFPLYKNVRDDKKIMAGRCRWDNSLGQPTNEAGLFGFSLTPEGGELLRSLLDAGETVILQAEVDAEYYDGECYTVSAALPGSDPDAGEVFIYGHLYEPGAHDNASGCAAILELARCFAEGVRSGALQRPARTIRFIVGYECIGSTAFYIAHPDICAATLCGATADMIGTEGIDKTYLRIWHNPMSNASFADWLIEDIFESLRREIGPEFHWDSKSFVLGSDNIMGDPYWDMPTIALIAEPAVSYHSSMDTPDRIEPRILARNAVLAGTYLYAAAIAGEIEAKEWLAPATIYFDEKTSGLGAELAEAARSALVKSLSRLRLRNNGAGRAQQSTPTQQSTQAQQPTPTQQSTQTQQPTPTQQSTQTQQPTPTQQSTQTQQPTPTQNIPEWALPEGSIIPLRAVSGCLTFLSRPDLKAGPWKPAWNTDLHRLLFWADGARSLWQIAVLDAQESGAAASCAQNPSVAGITHERWERTRDFFLFLAKHGYVKLC